MRPIFNEGSEDLLLGSTGAILLNNRKSTMFPHRLFLEGDVTSCSAVCYAPAQSSQTFEYLDTILRSAHRKNDKIPNISLCIIFVHE